MPEVLIGKGTPYLILAFPYPTTAPGPTIGQISEEELRWEDVRVEYDSPYTQVWARANVRIRAFALGYFAISPAELTVVMQHYLTVRHTAFDFTHPETAAVHQTRYRGPIEKRYLERSNRFDATVKLVEVVR